MDTNHQIDGRMPRFEGMGGRVDRRTLVRSGMAIGGALTAAGAVAGFGNTEVAAQHASETSVGEGSTPQIVTAAQAFLDSLDSDRRDAVVFSWGDTAQKQRWSNVPEGAFDRAGLMWGDLTEAPQAAWLALMRVTLSEEGYTRVLAEWAADDHLASGGSGGRGGGSWGGCSFGMPYYWVAIIGEPSETDSWQWQFGGHHITVNATVSGETLSLTPSFIGVQPGTFTDADGNTVRPLGDIEDEAFALINALDGDQRSAAIQDSSHIDLVLGPGEDGRTIEAEGLPASAMNEAQRTAFLGLIGHYAGLGNDVATAVRMVEIEGDLDRTYLAWYGSTAQGEPAYFRVTGPTVVIEYSPQELGGKAPDHIHGIYRDPTNDYGARYTGLTVGSEPRLDPRVSPAAKSCDGGGRRR